MEKKKVGYKHDMVCYKRATWFSGTQICQEASDLNLSGWALWYWYTVRVKPSYHCLHSSIRTWLCKAALRQTPCDRLDKRWWTWLHFTPQVLSIWQKLQRGRTRQAGPHEHTDITLLAIMLYAQTERFVVQTSFFFSWGVRKQGHLALQLPKVVHWETLTYLFQVIYLFCEPASSPVEHLHRRITPYPNISIDWTDRSPFVARFEDDS